MTRRRWRSRSTSPTTSPSSTATTSGTILRYLRGRLSADVAEDAAHEVFLRAFRQRAELRAAVSDGAPMAVRDRRQRDRRPPPQRGPAAARPRARVAGGDLRAPHPVLRGRSRAVRRAGRRAAPPLARRPRGAAADGLGRTVLRGNRDRPRHRRRHCALADRPSAGVPARGAVDRHPERPPVRREGSMSERDLDDLLHGLLDAANPPADALARVRGPRARPPGPDDGVPSRVRCARPSAPRAARCSRWSPSAASRPGPQRPRRSRSRCRRPGDRTIEIVADPANPSRRSRSPRSRRARRTRRARSAIFRALTRNGAPGVRPTTHVGSARPTARRPGSSPGPTRTCFGADNDSGTGYTCTSNASVMRGGLSTPTSTRRARSARSTWCPDEVVSADAGGQTFAPHNNLIVMTYPSGTE